MIAVSQFKFVVCTPTLQLDTALAMAPSERKARLDRDAAFVEQNTTSTWLQIAVQDMRRVQNTSDGIEVPKTLALTSFGATVQGQPVVPRTARERMLDLKELLDEGFLTQDEYEAKRADVLASL